MTEHATTELSPVRLQELLLEHPALDGFLTALAADLAAHLAHREVSGACITVVRPRRQTIRAGHCPGFPADAQISADPFSAVRSAADPFSADPFSSDPSAGVLATGLPVVVRHLAGELHRTGGDRTGPNGDVAAFASVPVPFDEPVPFTQPGGAVLTVYSDQPGAFGPEAVRAVERAAAEAATVLTLALRMDVQTHRAENLQAALESRTVVDLAAGIIMAQNNCSQQSAVDILRSVSNTRNVKVRDVAAGVVAVVSDRVSTHFEE